MWIKINKLAILKCQGIKLLIEVLDSTCKVLGNTEIWINFLNMENIYDYR